jgi:uncharacterized cupredoxin-like copper-binding protein
MTNRFRAITLALGLSAVSALSFASGSHGGGHDEVAIGQPGRKTNVSRTINIDMTDNMRFSSADIAVKQGETIRFLVKNSGQIKHELVLGTQKELKEHYAMMMKMPEMEHADANMVTVAPGKTGEVIWQFTKAGKVDFACLQPGHYDAGMKGFVTVAGGKAAAHAQTTVKPADAPMVIDSKKATAAPAGDMTEAEVRKVDMDTKKITLKHGDIKNLDMPSMTMVFQVKDPAMLDKVKAGDKVLFKAEKSNGAIVITDLQPSK